jgi:hypothetical protein
VQQDTPLCIKLHLNVLPHSICAPTLAKTEQPREPVVACGRRRPRHRHRASAALRSLCQCWWWMPPCQDGGRTVIAAVPSNLAEPLLRRSLRRQPARAERGGLLLLVLPVVPVACFCSEANLFCCWLAGWLALACCCCLLPGCRCCLTGAGWLGVLTTGTNLTLRFVVRPPGSAYMLVVRFVDRTRLTYKLLVGFVGFIGWVCMLFVCWVLGDLLVLLFTPAQSYHPSTRGTGLLLRPPPAR